MAENTHSADLESSSSQYLSITDAAQNGLDPSGDFTIALWARFESHTLAQSLIYKGNYNTNTRGYDFQWGNGGSQLSSRVSADGTTSNRVSSTYAWTPTDGVWYHLAVVFDVSETASDPFEFFIDGSSVGVGTTSLTGTVASINNNADPFYVGAQQGVSPDEIPFDGLVDEVVVTSDKLTAAEVLKLYQGYDATLFLDNIGGCWKLNNDLTDSSGNGNTLTNNGSAAFSETVPFDDYLSLFVPTITIF